MADIRNVVIAGGAGMIGSSIVTSLLKTNRYRVSVLTRDSEQHQFPSGVTILKVDYTSLDSLSVALQGQDVLISALSKFALQNELLLLEAAVNAQIRRVIPSEFGADLLNPRTRQFPNYREKVLIEERLFQLCCGSAMTNRTMSYTLVFNNVLLDWALTKGMIANPQQRLLQRYDDGDTPFSTTRVSTVGLAVAAILEKYDETANRAVYIQDTSITQNELLLIVSEVINESAEKQPLVVESSFPVCGSTSWTIRQIDTAAAERDARSGKEQSPERLFYSFAARGAFVAGFGGHFQRIDNELLGLKEITREELREIVRAALSGTSSPSIPTPDSRETQQP